MYNYTCERKIKLLIERKITYKKEFSYFELVERIILRNKCVYKLFESYNKQYSAKSLSCHLSRSKSITVSFRNC